MDSKFDIQAKQYDFPYHYLPVVEREAPLLHRELSWGLDYLTYMTFAADLITREIRPKSLIDVGCGDGRLLNLVNGQVDRLLGVDLVDQAIGMARAFNPQIEFFNGPVSQVRETFQCAALIEVMEHIPDSEYPAVIENVADVLVDQGVLVVSVPTVNLPLNAKHFRHYDLDILKQQLSCRFDVEKYWFLSKSDWISKIIRSMLINRFFVIRPAGWRRLVWRLHKRFSFHAGERTGGHLVAIARKKT